MYIRHLGGACFRTGGVLHRIMERGTWEVHALELVGCCTGAWKGVHQTLVGCCTRMKRGVYM